MSTATQEVKPKSEPLFSKKNRRLLTDPFNDNNPITVQVLGICSALAVTSTLANAFVMGLCVIAVTSCSNLIVSAIRQVIPSRIRMIVQLVVIATLVTIVSEFLKAFAYDISKQLSVFVGLIITNCIIMGRLEAFAMGNKPWPSFLDGIGNGIGYAFILLAVALLREVFGTGTLFKGLPFEISVIPNFIYELGYQNNGIMILPISSIILIGVFIWIQRGWNRKLVDVS